MSARFAVALVLVLAGGWIGAAPAAALEPGVFADPGSPAGKEYIAPLSALRGDGSGHPAIEGQPQPLFGSGITPPGASTGAQGRESRTAARGRRRGHGGGTRSATAARTGSARAASAPRSAPAPLEAGGSAAPTIDLLVAAVVVGGLALGGLVVAVRRWLE